MFWRVVLLLAACAGSLYLVYTDIHDRHAPAAQSVSAPVASPGHSDSCCIIPANRGLRRGQL